MPKRTKAIKISDLRSDKPWLKKVGIQSYEVESRERKRTFLIVCEGQTEELYFKSFPVVSADVKPIHQGCSKSSLVECTKSYLEDESYDEIWCVFDLDTKPDVEGQNDDFNAAINSANQEGFKCAYSNDAFELWFVLHYQFLDQQQHRTYYFRKLSEYWNIDYEKQGKKRDFAKSIYKLLLNDKSAKQSMAITYAKKLYEQMKNEQFHLQNPVTKVYELVEVLNSHIRK